MKVLGRIAAISSVSLLAGCFSFQQSISVTPNGEVTFFNEIAVMTEMMTMLGEDTSDFCPTDADDDVPPEFTVTYEESVRDADTVCAITATGPIGEFADALETGALMPTDNAGDGAPVMTLVDEGGGEYTFTVVFTSIGEEGEMDAEAQAMMAMMAPLFEGRTLTWALTAPRIVSVNDESAYVTVDGKTATMTVPAIDMVNQVGAEYSLVVRFAL